MAEQYPSYDYPSGKGGAYEGLHTKNEGGATYAAPCGPPPPQERPMKAARIDPVPYRPSRAVAVLRGGDDAGPMNLDTSLNRDTSRDWICESCENLNFSARRECKRCSKPRPALPRFASTRLSKNPWTNRDVKKDWRCPSCDNVNFAGRDKCNRCARPQPSNLRAGNVYRATIPKDVCPTIKLFEAKPPPTMEKNPEWDGKGGGLGPLLPVKKSHPSHSTRDPEKDWRCPCCNNVNYCGRVHCYKCRSPIPFDGYEAIHGSSDGYEKIKPPRSQRLPKQPRRQSAFDWVCASCTNVNYSGRLNCNRCLRPVTNACKLVTPKNEIAQRQLENDGEQQVPEAAPAFLGEEKKGAPAPAFLSDEALALAAANAETLDGALDVASRVKGPRALEAAAKRLATADGARRNDVRRDHRFLSFLRALRTRLLDEDLGPSETANVAVALARLGCGGAGLDRDGRAFEGRAFASLGRRASNSLDAYGGSELSALVWAFAQSKQELVGLAAVAQKCVAVPMAANELANALWGLASLNAQGVWPPGAARALSWGRLDGPDLAKCIWALARNNETTAVAALAAKIGDVAPWPSSAVARVSIGLCQEGDHALLLLKCATHVLARVSEYASTELVDVAWALSRTDARAFRPAVDVCLEHVDCDGLDCESLARLFDTLGAVVEPTAEAVEKATDAAAALGTWRPAPLARVAIIAARLDADDALLTALAAKAVTLREACDGPQRRALKMALGARLPAAFDAAAVVNIAAAAAEEPAPLLPASAPAPPAPPPPPPLVPRPPPPPPLAAGPSLLPAFLTNKLKGDFLKR